MKFMLHTSVKKSLDSMCRDHGFHSRGQIYFRIHADSIVQAIGLRYERVFNHYSLNVGLMSMYSQVDKDAFSARSFLPRYSICCLDGEATAVPLGTENGMTTFTVRSPESQLGLLNDKGFDWLNSITTQELLLDAINHLDNVAYKSTIWNDELKLTPFLVLGDYSSADYVIASILNQQLGPKSFSLPPWTEDGFLQYSILCSNKNEDLLYLHRLIVEKEEDSIKAYLDKNYSENAKMLRFLRK